MWWSCSTRQVASAIINIAQGVMVILGAYLSYVLSVHLGIGLLPGS